MNAVRNLGIATGLLYVFIEVFDLSSTLYVSTDSSQAAAPWLAVSPVFEVLVDKVEVVGGMWVLLVTWGALLAGKLPRALNYLGVVVGVAGIFTVFPAFEALGVGFRLGEMVWFVWLGIFVLHSSQSAAARRLRAFFLVLASHAGAKLSGKEVRAMDQER